MKKGLLTILLNLFLISLFAQVSKTYSGSYPLRDKDIKGEAVYNYYEKNYEKIYHGDFSFSGKIYDNYSKEQLATIKISGNLIDNKRNGLWTAKSSASDGSLSEEFSANYLNGMLNGDASFIRIDIIQGYKKISKMVCSFSSNKYTGTYKHSQTFNDYVIEEVTGTFDTSGFMNGTWTIKYIQNRYANTFADIKATPIIEDVREYKNGLCYKNVVTNLSTMKIIKDYDNSEFLDEFFSYYNAEDNICAHGGKFYKLDTIKKDEIYFGSQEGSKLLGLLFFWNTYEIGNLLTDAEIGFVDNAIYVEKNTTDIGSSTVIAKTAQEYITNDDLPNAIKYMKYIIQAEPENLRILYNLGRFQLLNKDFSDGLQTLTKALTLSQKNPTNEFHNFILAGYANALLLNNQYAKAIEIYKTNINIMFGDKDWTTTINKEFDYYVQNGINNPDIEKVRLELDKELKYNTAITSGDNLFKEKKYGKAKKEYSTALEIRPEDNYAQEQKKKSGKKAVGKTVLTIVLLPFYIIGWVLF